MMMRNALMQRDLVAWLAYVLYGEATSAWVHGRCWCADLLLAATCGTGAACRQAEAAGGGGQQAAGGAAGGAGGQCGRS